MPSLKTSCCPVPDSSIVKPTNCFFQTDESRDKCPRCLHENKEIVGRILDIDCDLDLEDLAWSSERQTLPILRQVRARDPASPQFVALAPVEVSHIELAHSLFLATGQLYDAI